MSCHRPVRPSPHANYRYHRRDFYPPPMGFHESSSIAVVDKTVSHNNCDCNVLRLWLSVNVEYGQVRGECLTWGFSDAEMGQLSILIVNPIGFKYKTIIYYFYLLANLLI